MFVLRQTHTLNKRGVELCTLYAVLNNQFLWYYTVAAANLRSFYVCEYAFTLPTIVTTVTQAFNFDRWDHTANGDRFNVACSFLDVVGPRAHRIDKINAVSTPSFFVPWCLQGTFPRWQSGQSHMAKPANLAAN